MLTEKEFLDIIGKTIHKHRNIKKLSCEKLAELSEVDYSSLNLIENGKQTPRSYTLYKILYSLDIDIIDKIYPTNNSIADLLINKIKLLDNIEKLNKPTDRTHWAMPGHMVNACYDPFVNDITFPAAILQPPFYSINQTRSENLGGIGAVIGHEISHAFDSNGAKCDENGNINNWWTKEDNRKFKKKINAMIKQFDGIELPWGKVNGKFIVSENMADNGGMGVTLEIMSKTPNVSYEEYFQNWAKVWCLKAKPEYFSGLYPFISRTLG